MMRKRITIEIPSKLRYCIEDGEKTSTMFKRVLKDVDKDIIVILDFRKTTYIDSSGLGILLWLRNWLGDESKIVLVNISNYVWKILRMANFQILFNFDFEDKHV